MLNLLTQFVRKSPVIAFIKSVEGRYELISDAWLTAFRTTEAAVVGKTDLELFGEQVAADFVANDRQILATGQPSERVERVVVAGETRTFLSTKFLLFDEAGERRGVAGFAVDITESERTLEALRQSERRARDLVDHGPLAYVVIELATLRLIEVNENATQLFRGPREKLLGTTLADISPLTQPDGSLSRETGRAHLQALSAGPRSFNWVLKTLERERLPARVWLTMEANSATPAARAAILDLRAIEHANEQLSQQRRFLEQTQSMAHVGGWEIDVPKRTTVWTSETARLFDLEPTQVPPSIEDSLALYAPESRAEVSAAMRAALDHGTPFRIEPEVLTAKGRRRRVRVRGVAHVVEGRPRRLFGAIQDITEERALEEQLRHASRMDAVGQLAAGVAHDFNNMLGAIVAAAEAVKLDPLTQGGTEAVETILSAAEQAASLTRQLLRFSRKERTRRVPADLHVVVTDVLGMLQRTIERRITIELQLRATHTRLLADVPRLSSALVNLAVNARDAMPNGGTLRFRTEDEGPGRVRLEVIDTGTGIAPEVMPHLFEPFFTTKERGRGTGLGLASVFTTVREHDGQISVRSELKRGTTFTLVLPTDEAAVAAAPDAPPSAISYLGRSVLLVDDEDLVRRSLRRLLRNLGFTVLEASDGPGALAFFEPPANAPSLVILDLMMGGQAPLEVFHAIRAKAPGLPVLVCSGYAPEPVLHELSAQPRVLRLMKPFSLDDLRRGLAQLLAA